jgi:hypothetical protein
VKQFLAKEHLMMAKTSCESEEEKEIISCTVDRGIVYEEYINATGF